VPYLSVDRGIATRFARAAEFMHRRKYPILRFPQIDPTDPLPSETPTDAFLGGFYAKDATKSDPIRLETPLGGRSRLVNVYEYEKSGQDAADWPAITYRFVDERFRAENYHPIDPLADNCRDCGFTTDAVTGEVKSGPDTVTILDHPDPITLEYEIKVWAQTKEEGYALLSLVKRLFPARTFLEVCRRDRSVVTYDVIRTRGPVWAGGLDPTLPEGDPGERFYSWAITYEVEAYEDNTLEAGEAGDIHPTILQRCVTIEPRDTEGDPAPDGVPFETPGRC